MITKEKVKSLIKTIKKVTGQPQYKISEIAGYEPKTLTQLISKGDALESVYNQLLLAFKGELNNSTSEDNDLTSNLILISKNLHELKNGQSAIRAEIRAYGQYQIWREVKWDEAQYLKAKAVVDKIYGANLKVDEQQDSSRKKRKT